MLLKSPSFKLHIFYKGCTATFHISEKAWVTPFSFIESTRNCETLSWDAHIPPHPQNSTCTVFETLLYEWTSVIRAGLGKQCKGKTHRLCKYTPGICIRAAPDLVRPANTTTETTDPVRESIKVCISTLQTIHPNDALLMSRNIIP